jgi:hypothetical protein
MGPDNPRKKPQAEGDIVTAMESEQSQG